MKMSIDSRFFQLEPIPGHQIALTITQAREVCHFLNNHKMELRPNKNWSECPYESHGDNCTCKGEGGER